MFFKDIEKTPDLEPQPYCRGTRWFAQYRVPWGVRIVMDHETRKPKPFDTKHDAKDAATAALCCELRNKATGWQSQPLNASLEAAEALFRKGENGG